VVRREKMNGLDAVALAIMCDESGHLNDPTVPAIRNLNPGNLRIPGQPSDAGGYTIFSDFTTGYAALIRDLQAKFSGNNTHGLGPMSTLEALLNVYAPPSDNNPTTAYAQFVAGWVAKALGKPITVTSELCNIWQAPQAVMDASDD
jgi:hypothetical protein